MKKIIFKWAELFQRDFDRPEFFEKADIILRLLVVLLVAAVFLGHLDKVFTIPVEKPYYTGTWDEPFAVNAGINAIYRDGDPVFYNYGGTSVYPFALVFYKYCKANNIQPYYKTLDTKFKNPSWPITRKIYPVKPIYITKVFAYIAFLAGAFFFTALFSYYLLPVPFWLIPSITTASVFIKYSTQMLPETHLGLLAGVTAIAFVKAVIEKKISRYFLLVVICAAAASLTVAAKINAVFIVFLPIALLWRLVSQKYLTLKRSALTAAAFIIPYILVNPAVIINFSGYKAWLSFMRKLSGTGSESLAGRQSGFLPFLQDLYMADALPVALVILLVLFTCIILVKRNPAALAGILAFFSLSLYTIGNMKHMLFDRHFVFLILPFNILVLFPLVYLYRRAPKSARAALTAAALIITLWAFPPGETLNRIGQLNEKNFTSQWEPESRDQLAEFVISTGALLHFYDVHGFSLPDTIHNRIIPFSDTAVLPRTLEPHEYVAFIRYKKSGKGQVDHQGKYNRDLRFLLEKYKPVNVFGKPGGNNDINVQAPQSNPTIVLMKPKEAQ